MTILEQAIFDSRIETAQNEIRSIHNDFETKRIFSKKQYLSYDSTKFIRMVHLVMRDIESKPTQ